jgi:hypothetical protein
MRMHGDIDHKYCECEREDADKEKAASNLYFDQPSVMTLERAECRAGRKKPSTVSSANDLEPVSPPFSNLEHREGLQLLFGPFLFRHWTPPPLLALVIARMADESEA